MFIVSSMMPQMRFLLNSGRFPTLLSFVVQLDKSKQILNWFIL